MNNSGGKCEILSVAVNYKSAYVNASEPYRNNRSNSFHPGKNAMPRKGTLHYFRIGFNTRAYSIFSAEKYKRGKEFSDAGGHPQRLDRSDSGRLGFPMRPFPSGLKIRAVQKDGDRSPICQADIHVRPEAAGFKPLPKPRAQAFYKVVVCLFGGLRGGGGMK